MKILIYLMIFLLANSAESLAQIPTCTGGNNSLIYLNKGTSLNIQNYDPSLAISGSNPSLNTIVASGPGLAVNKNINAQTPAVTFYSTITSGSNVFFTYFNGSTWVNTGHQTGNNNSNIAGGGNYLYGLTGISSNQIGIWQYDGTGNANLITSFPIYTNVADIVADCLGNFYVVSQPTITSSWVLQMFNPNGNIVKSWNVSGLPATISNNALPGLAIIGNKVYLSTSAPQLWEGIISGNNVNFSSITTSPAVLAVDFANCPTAPLINAIADIDTGYDCGQGVNVKAFGDGPFIWSVLSGNATVIGSGNQVSIKSSGISKILLQTSSASVCGTDTTDTVTVIGPVVVLDAGLSDTIHGCGSFRDTLSATFSGNPSWLTYQFNWTPLTSVLSGSNTLNPIVQQSGYTKYTLTVSTQTEQGGCTWSDDVDKYILDHTVNADFSHNIIYGCSGDSVTLINTSTGAFKSTWDFGNGSVPDTNKSPKYFYNKQDVYDITLLVTNNYCSDTLVKQVNILHPLEAKFTTDKKTVCKNDTITFDGSGSVALKTIALPSYFWYFGDGKTGIGEIVTHTYEDIDTYNVMMVLTDFIPCTDTAWETIVPDVNNLPFIELGSDTIICKGDEFLLPLASSKIDFYLWSDNSIDNQLSVTMPGMYFVTAANRCGTVSDSVDVTYKNCKVWLPNAFTPNGDGKNDLLSILGDISSMSECSYSIYNRFGEKIFHTNNPYDGWDGLYKGKPQPLGTYYYQVIYKAQEKQELLKGDIILLR